MKIIENKELIIKPLDKTIVQNKDDPLPDTTSSFVWLISAAKGMGKSTALVNYLTKKKFMLKKFHNVYIASATARNDEKWNRINLDSIAGFMSGTWDEDTIQGWAEEARENAHDGQLSCLVCDDYASMLKSSPALQHWLLNSRHAKTSMFITSQKMTLFPPIYRENADCFQMFKPNTKLELDFIADNILGPLTDKKNVEQLISHAWKNDRSFIFVNRRHRPGRQLYVNFDRVEFPQT